MKFVSAVMPTRGRPRFALAALECFYSQDYPARELVVIDDADDPSFPAGVDHPKVRYVVNQQRLGIPHKRNQATRLAQGLILVNFDSDDWSAPNRISDQVQRLESSGKVLDGYHSLLFFNETDGKAWKYHGRNYACGASMCFWKWWAELNPFREHKAASPHSGHIIGTDNELARTALNAGRLSCVDGGQMLVARIHGGNSSHAYERLGMPGSNFKEAPLDSIPKEFFECAPVS